MVFFDDYMYGVMICINLIIICLYGAIHFQQDLRTNINDPVLDMNIVPVFYELGITGKGVNVTVADDGLEWTHPEILLKFVSYELFKFKVCVCNLMNIFCKILIYKYGGEVNSMFINQITW